MCVLGMAEEFREAGVAVNALWPRTTIATAALQIIPGAKPELGRTPEIMADAAHRVLTRDSRSLTGRFLIDEEVLHEAGIRDFERYAVKPGEKLRIEGRLEEAVQEFQKALIADPSSAIALQEIKRIQEMLRAPARIGAKADERGLTPAELSRRRSDERVDSMLGPPELKPM